MTTLGKRVATALVLVLLVGVVLFALPRPVAFGFFSAVLLWGAWEWSGFFIPARRLWRSAFVVACLALAMLWLWRAHSWFASSYLIFAAAAWWLVLGIWLGKRDKRITNLFTGLAGLCCLMPAWVALSLILDVELGSWLLVWLVSIVAAADIGAYFTGKAVGRRKLAPRLSPGKTLEGVAGGLVAATVVAVGGAAAFGFPPALGAALGPMVAAVSVVGDLSVSAFKRHAELKDTGWILPGHGGVMDRVDSLVAAAPVFVAVLTAAGPLA